MFSYAPANSRLSLGRLCPASEISVAPKFHGQVLTSDHSELAVKELNPFRVTQCLQRITLVYEDLSRCWHFPCGAHSRGGRRRAHLGVGKRWGKIASFGNIFITYKDGIVYLIKYGILCVAHGFNIANKWIYQTHPWLHNFIIYSIKWLFVCIVFIL